MFIPNLIFGKIITTEQTEQGVGLKMISHDKFSSDYVWIKILLMNCCLAMLAHSWENRTFAI